MKVLLTGAAGFIGYHLASRFGREGAAVTCIDNINDYYDTDLKYGRLAALGIKLSGGAGGEFAVSQTLPSVRFKKADICDARAMASLFENENTRFDAVVHLAAQAGVRYSLTAPRAYISSNIEGFLNILEAARARPPGHLVYASSSSVYGLGPVPFREDDAADRPANLYAASKRSNELMAAAYSHLYGLPVTGLRFFTVYGPWGRPDMAPFIFAKAILEGAPIAVFNGGDMARDFTFIDDIVEGVVRVAGRIPEAGEGGALYNIGNGRPVPLMDFLSVLEGALGKKALVNFAPMQAGDMARTWADCSRLERDTGFKPSTDLACGLKKFADWYKDYRASRKTEVF